MNDKQAQKMLELLETINSNLDHIAGQLAERPSLEGPVTQLASKVDGVREAVESLEVAVQDSAG